MGRGVDILRNASPRRLTREKGMEDEQGSAAARRCRSPPAPDRDRAGPGAGAAPMGQVGLWSACVCVPHPVLSWTEKRKLPLVKILVSSGRGAERSGAVPVPGVAGPSRRPRSPSAGGKTRHLCHPARRHQPSRPAGTPGGPLTYEEDDAEGVCQDHVSKSTRSSTCEK